MADRPYSVSEITQVIKGVLEQALPPVWVTGEISQYTHHTSGHRYFTLKDEAAQIKCVMFRGHGRLSFAPEAGMQVFAYGTVSVYERNGQHQLYVSQMSPAGAGAAAAALGQLRERLAAEGLFDEARKRPLPGFPACVGAVTSPTGAAIRDIATVIGRRAPWVRVVLAPARVQGEGAALEVVRAVEALNAWGGADVLIVGRGGGAAEDLSAFNDERVVRAIFGSRLPVVSAVGHEIDVTLSDLAADRRAATPSAAAELAVPDRGDLARRVADLLGRSREAVERMLEVDEQLVTGATASYGLRRFVDSLDQHAQRIDDIESDLRDHLVDGLKDRMRAYRDLTGLLGTLSPLGTLTRGYSICQRLPDGRVVRDSAEVEVGGRVRVRFAKGEAICAVEEKTPLS
ncbi:MAG: exodeoxyribonuclease VII large subunit [Candidatus Handelsmanbacteria bacterium RIFCSPLOWO2_12_FULL_64_10]|uniref:Exodeoxyribonuclease 7 large subunit n=1 Tax=Handelsmanbacteria sp. (strain RIFCSPLOWO2_12_FULL_64_10) TaxID=1817868 RepID=A0A1F6CAR6_HANXR|nr:MAG: exodeoxyribonuclease VII large subunit [Candidatus Handelsmanbacteria bacterium RIFCSPLOWO2_12_FULL_64_10]